MPTVTTEDGAQIYYKDWGVTGSPVILSHGWPLNADAWDSAARFLGEHGHRAITHDRRGHGRSSQTWDGNEMDTYAADLATLIETLDLRDLTLVGHSTGGGEIARYVGRYGSDRVAKLVLVSAVPPLMLRTADNPDGLPVETFDASGPARQPTERSSTGIWPTGRSSATTATTTSPRGCGMRSGFRAWRAGTAAHSSASPRSPRPIFGPTSPRSTSRLSSSTVTTTRSFPSRWAASGPPR